MNGGYEPPPGSGGGGIGGFPKVVAAFNFTGKTGTFSFEILPDTLPTGDYLLNDYLTVTTPDSGATLQIDVSFADDSGPVAGVGGLPSHAIGGSFNFAGGASGGPGTFYTFSSPFHAVTGTPIIYTATAIGETVLAYDIHLTLTRLQ